MPENYFEKASSAQVERFKKWHDLGFIDVAGMQYNHTPMQIPEQSCDHLEQALADLERRQARLQEIPLNGFTVSLSVTSKDPDTEYLSDGITESIINSLSQLPNLKVMSRNASFRFKNQGTDPQEAGTNLHVGAVLTGRVVKLADQVLIKTELIKVSDGSQIWGEQYSSSLANILAIQDEV